MPKRKLTESRKSRTLAKEKPRNPNHMVIVTAQDETDDDGNPIITVLRMRAADLERSRHGRGGVANLKKGEHNACSRNRHKQ